MSMKDLYHDPDNPQYDAVERYHLESPDSCACVPLPSEGCCHRVKYDGICILRSQVMYDVNAELSVVTRARRSESQLQDNNIENTEAVEPLLNRWFDRHLNIAIRKLSAFTPDEAPATATNRIRNQEEYCISLNTPSYWESKNIKALTDAVHEYIVNAIIYEYLLLYLTAKDPLTISKEQQKELALEDIHNIVCSVKPGSVRKVLHPFP